jgi:hypothetical protein
MLALVLLAPSSLVGCYWKYRNAAGDPFPQRVSVEPIGGAAGVFVNPTSSEPEASSISKTAVVELFAQRLDGEKLFETVIFPYSPLAKATPAILLDTTVHIYQKHYWAENYVKAILTGVSILTLGPVLATHFGVVVDLSVDARSADGNPIGTYSYRSEYDFHYTTMTPRQSKMDEWLDTAKRHAIEEVLNQLKQDRSKFIHHSKVVGILLQ